MQKLDKSDFKNLVEKHQENVRNLCFKYLRSREDADDVAQDVFIQVYESLTSFRSEAEISTWIFRIAVNKSIDALRKKKRKKRYAQLISIFGTGEDDPPLEISSGENVQENFEQSERVKHLNKAIESLPDNQKTALILSKYHGFSNKEIAEILNTSISAVESLIHRSKKNLHKKLYDIYDGIFK
ncbi:MAG: RNA polymerase sigma factor [Melioribacteraceae bacterium]|nr:RNA polymerase sigma factor [Melioribacteraceae bacterium]MCF8356752.1 RNA polymerase sigma factor [Melioribacteraceae bacterium]MCF8396143.1 RNA polymerase sigma factor [Melioribacteraceae bacterium]MCF8421120.1 RNA polymerase sigma factor [Melioribacteraceae bacterium]